jgi:nucleotidyltransferase substrate binding protein (TIGR01987 family)
MAHSADIRWLQRFQNFKRAYTLLRDAISERDIDKMSDLEHEGLIQRFEYTFELGWKTLKDYLAYSGIKLTETSPRSVIKQCVAGGIFTAAGIDAEVYLKMLLERNAMSHIYDEDRFREALENVQDEYLAQFTKQYDYFRAKETELHG